MRFKERLPSRMEMIPDFISMMVEKLFYLPLDEDIIFKIRLALHEAVINAVKHGNKMNSALPVDILILAEDSRITIEVTDQGAGFNAKNIPDPTNRENLTKLEGRGIFLIRHLMDKVQFINNGRTIKMMISLKKERRGKVLIHTEKLDDVTVVVALNGEINVNNAQELQKAFAGVIQNGGAKVVVDFSKVTFIDSSGLATLIDLDQKLKKNNGRLHLCHVNKKIKGIFEITKIHKMIRIFDTRQDALKDFAG